MRPALLTVVGLMCLAPLIVACTRTAGADTNGGQPAAADPTAKVAKVVLVANLEEADENCGCGQMIRAVRSAGAKGLATREVDTRNKGDLAAATKAYRILVQPSVVMVDGADHEVRRYEGESKDTVSKLMTDLESLVNVKK